MHQVLQDQCLLILLLPLFRRTSHPHVKINKMVSKHTANYHHSPSVLTWRIHPLMFPQTLELHLSSKILCYIFFWKQLYASPWLGKNGEVLRVLEKLFANQKIESRHFTHARKVEFTPRFPHYSPCSALLIPPMQHFFWKSITSVERGQETMMFEPLWWISVNFVIEYKRLNVKDWIVLVKTFHWNWDT